MTAAIQLRTPQTEQTEPYSPVPTRLINTPGISKGAKLLYGRLAQYAGHDGKCFPKISTLARELAVSQRQINRYINELVRRDLVRVRRRGQGKSNVYYLRKPAVAYRSDTEGASRPDTEGASHPLYEENTRREQQRPRCRYLEAGRRIVSLADFRKWRNLSGIPSEKTGGGKQEQDKPEAHRERKEASDSRTPASENAPEKTPVSGQEKAILAMLKIKGIPDVFPEPQAQEKPQRPADSRTSGTESQEKPQRPADSRTSESEPQAQKKPQRPGNTPETPQMTEQEKAVLAMLKESVDPEIEAMVLMALKQHGQAWIESQIEYCNRRAKENYPGYLRKAIQNDWARRPREKAERAERLKKQRLEQAAEVSVQAAERPAQVMEQFDSREALRDRLRKMPGDQIGRLLDECLSGVNDFTRKRLEGLTGERLIENIGFLIFCEGKGV